MTKKVTLFSGRVATVDPTEVSAERYDFLRLAEAEPSLGAPAVDGAFNYSTTSGQRAWTTQLTTDANGNLQTAGVTITDNRIQARNTGDELEIGTADDPTGTVRITSNLEVDGDLTVNGNLSVDIELNEIVLAEGAAITIGGSEVLSEFELGPTVQTIGTITTGVWNASPIQPLYGGTGLAGVQTNAILIGQDNTTMKQLIGQPYQVLQVDATGQPIFTGLDYGRY